MNRNSFLALLSIAMFFSQSHAQDLDLADLHSQVQTNFHGQRFQQARVDTIPTNYFADDSMRHQNSEAEQSSTAQQNLLILCCFATLLAAGSIITAFSVMKRRQNARRVSAAPPIASLLIAD